MVYFQTHFAGDNHLPDYLIYHLQHGLPRERSAVLLAGPEATLQDVETIRKAYHLDAPIVIQYGRWL